MLGTGQGLKRYLSDEWLLQINAKRRVKQMGEGECLGGVRVHARWGGEQEVWSPGEWRGRREPGERMVPHIRGSCKPS